MVTSSLLASREVDNERGVILEEIAMHDDDPGDSVHDTFAELVWPAIRWAGRCSARSSRSRR